MFKRINFYWSYIIFLISCMGVGCKTDTSMISSTHNSPEETIEYSIVFPSDLPSGGEYKNKFNNSCSFSEAQIKQQYSSMHRMGWNKCLVELDHKWDLNQKPIFLMQGYGWQEKGYINGYNECLNKIKEIKKTDGLRKAKHIVHQAALKLTN